jgi:hypothetical protein
MNLVHTLTPCSCKLHFNIILSSKLIKVSCLKWILYQCYKQKGGEFGFLDEVIGLFN